MQISAEKVRGNETMAFFYLQTFEVSWRFPLIEGDLSV
jgi:hypothetical protein